MPVETTVTLPPHLRARGNSAEARRTTRDLTLAIRDGALMLHFQRRLRLATLQTVGAEALPRWPHRSRGPMAPPGFLAPSSLHALAERRNQMNVIGAWALRGACAAAFAWPAPLTVSVDVAVRQIADGSVLPHLAQALEASGLPPERLEIELTEAVLLDTDPDTLLTLSAIRDLGIGIALDDFGAGAAGCR